MKQPLYIFITTSLMCFMLLSCNNVILTDSDRYGHYSAIPYKSVDDGNWGMITYDGKILFSDEFERLPTRVAYERFLVKNKDSLYNYYTTDWKPKRIGKAYTGASDFNKDGLAVVCQVKRGITVINSDGEELFDVDKATKKNVDQMSGFNNSGLAIFKVGHDFGVINTGGNVVLKPNYSLILLGNDNKILAIDRIYEKDIIKSNFKNVEVSIFNNKGQEEGHFSHAKFISVSQSLDGYFVAYEKIKEDSICGLIDPNGSWVIKPDLDSKRITQCVYGAYVYYDGDKYGLKSIKGEELIRPKYDAIYISGDNLCWAYDINNNVVTCKLIDFKDNQVCGETYRYATDFSDGHAIAKINDNDWVFLDTKGREIKDAPTIDNIDFTEASKYVSSNYLDIPRLIKSLAISSNGVDGMTLFMDVKSIINLAYEHNDSIDTYSHVYKDVDYHIGENVIEYSKRFHNTTVNYKVFFSKPIVIKDSFTNDTPSEFVVRIPYFDNANGRLMEIYNSLVKSVKKMGHVVKTNSNAIVVSGKDCVFVAIMVGDQVVLKMYKKGSIDSNNIDISKYQGLKEMNWLEHNYDREYIDPSDDDYSAEEIDSVVVDDYEY